MKDYTENAVQDGFIKTVNKKRQHQRRETATKNKSKNGWRVNRFSGLNLVASKSVNVPTEQPCSAVISLKQARSVSR
jgi:hypothetical protein